MLTFQSLGGSALSVSAGSKSLSVFTEPGKAGAKVTAALYSTPDEQPPEGTISWPGEYDLDGIAIRGIGHDEGRQVSFTTEIDGVRCAFVSSPLQEFTDHELELLGDVDVLAIPTDDAKLVQRIVDEVDPRVLIPLRTKDDKTFTEVLKACGATGKEEVDEWKMKGGLPTEGREVVLLKVRK